MSSDTNTRDQDLPEGWENVALMDVCSPKQWKTIAVKDLLPTGYSVYGANGQIGFFSEFNHAEPTVLIGCRGSCGAIKVSPPNCYVTGNAMALDDLDGSRVDRDYLAALLGARGMADVITGTAQPQITRKSLEDVVLPLPPLDEQRAIVVAIEDAFARIDAIEAELDAVERLAGSLERSLLRDALTGAILGNQSLSSDTGLPPGWRYAAIGEITDVSLGRQKSPEHATGEHMVSYIRAANLTWDGLDLADVKEMNFSPAEQSKYSLREGDVLVCEASGSATEVGKAVVWHGELPLACFQNHVIRLRPKDEVTSDYLHLAVTESARLGRFVRAVSGIGIMNLGLKRMREWKIACPPIEQQSEVVDAWERSTAQRVALLAAVTEGRALIGQLRARTLHSAFTGNRDHLQRSEKARVA